MRRQWGRCPDNRRVSAAKHCYCSRLGKKLCDSTNPAFRFITKYYGSHLRVSLGIWKPNPKLNRDEKWWWSEKEQKGSAYKMVDERDEDYLDHHWKQGGKPIIFYVNPWIIFIISCLVTALTLDSVKQRCRLTLIWPDCSINHQEHCHHLTSGWGVYSWAN